MDTQGLCTEQLIMKALGAYNQIKEALSVGRRGFLQQVLKLVVDHEASSGNVKTHDPRIATHLKLPSLCENLSLSLVQKCGEMRTVASPVQRESHSLGLRQSKMFRPSCRSPFSLTDLDMWDTKSHFSSQSSAWCGMASVSGTGFLSKASSSASGNTNSFRQDSGLKKWQSLSHLASQGATRSYPLSPGAELRATRGERSYRHAEVGQWLQDAHERVDTQLDRLRTRNSHLSYNMTNQFESRQQGELHEKFSQLEKNLLHMRSSLDRGDNNRPKAPESLNRSSSVSQQDFTGQERQKVDTELYKLRDALRNAEAKAMTQEQELKQVLNKLQTSTETQRTLLNQIEEMNQRFSQTKQNHSEVQEQLSEANNKISQACLEKAVLSTQVLKLEDDIKDLKAKLRESDRDQPIKEKQSANGCGSHINQQDQTFLIKEESKALRELNEKLTCELKTTQTHLQEITAERVIMSKQITDLTAQCSQLIREKEELMGKMNEDCQEELTEMKEKCSKLRETVEALKQEKMKLQDQCLCLEAEVLEKEEKLHLQEEEYQKQDALRVQSREELKAVVSHWTEKWQKVALTLQSTQDELEEVKKKHSKKELQADTSHLENDIEKLNKERQKDKEEIENMLQHKANVEAMLNKAKDSESLLRIELDACKQELELERSRGLLHRNKGAGAVQTQDKETLTDLSESSLLWEPPSDSHCSHNKPPQVTDDKLSGEDQKIKSVCPVTLESDQQRRMVTEQLKSLFKEREEKEVEIIISRSAAQTGVLSLQDWTPDSNALRGAGDRRGWQQGPGLMPVFEEDEESSEQQEGEEPADKAHPDDNSLKQCQQRSTVTENNNLKAKNATVHQATLRCNHSTQDCLPTAIKQTDKTPEHDLLNPSPCSDEIDLQQKKQLFLYPDGTFLAELVDLCSPDEDEEEDEGE